MCAVLSVWGCVGGMISGVIEEDQRGMRFPLKSKVQVMEPVTGWFRKAGKREGGPSCPSAAAASC